MNKQHLCIFLFILLAAACFPLLASAADGTIDADGTYDIGDYGDYSYITIDSAGSTEGLTVTLTNTSGATYYGIQISCTDAGTKLTIDGLIIDNSVAYNHGPIMFNGAGNTLTLVGASSVIAPFTYAGVQVETGAALTINGSGSLYAAGGGNGAGIGGTQFDDSGSITIESGTVTAVGGDGAAGIGGGCGQVTGYAATHISSSGGNYGEIIFKGGTVTASTAGRAAGIGGGYYGSGGSITIEGGTVTATGIGGAGIGGGSSEAYQGATSIVLVEGGDSGMITISGGVVNATSKSHTFIYNNATTTGTGAGIGGGIGGAGGAITISGGVVTATSSSDGDPDYGGAGIGGGAWNDDGTTTISGGTVTASGTAGGAGVGSGNLFNMTGVTLYDGGTGAGGVINIQDGTVTATSGRYGAGIGGGGSTDSPITGASGGTITISGGVVYADGSTEYNAYDVGPGANASDGTLTISGTSSVFLRSNSSLTPTLPVPHLHKTTTDAVEPMEVVNGTVYGIAGTGVSPWADALGGYFLLNRIVYNANGGEGAVSNSAQVPDSTALVKSSEGMSLSGYVFSSWNTTEDGTGTEYLPDDPLTLSASSITLYAQWELAPVQVPQTGDTTAPLLYAALALLGIGGSIALVYAKTKPKAR